VLQRLKEELQADIKDIYDEHNNVLPVHKWPEIFRTGLTVGVDVTTSDYGEGVEGTITRVRLPDKIKRLEFAGRHVEVKAFEEVHRIEAGTSIVEVMEKARERAAEKKL
jgi:phage terminase small subunit